MFNVVLSPKSRKALVAHFEQCISEFVLDACEEHLLKEKLCFAVDWDGYKPYAMVEKRGLTGNSYCVRLEKKTCRRLVEAVLSAEPILYPNSELKINPLYDFNYMKLNVKLYDLRQVLLANLMFVHCIFHEVGHAILGHVDYDIFEKTYELSNNDLIAEEYYADLFGFQSSFKFLFRYFNDNLSETIIIYIEMCYRLWEHIHQNYDDSDNKDHPAVLIRMRYMVDWLEQEIKNPDYKIEEKEQSKIIKTCELLYVLLHNEPDPDKIKELYNEENACATMIRSNLETLDVLMKPYAYNRYGIKFNDSNNMISEERKALLRQMIMMNEYETDADMSHMYVTLNGEQIVLTNNDVKSIMYGCDIARCVFAKKGVTPDEYYKETGNYVGYRLYSPEKYAYKAGSYVESDNKYGYCFSGSEADLFRRLFYVEDFGTYLAVLVFVNLMEL